MKFFEKAIALTLTLIYFIGNISALKPEIELNSDLLHNQEGCAVFFDENSNSWHIYNSETADVQFTPMCTFKIILTLAGLRYEILENENTKFESNGQTLDLKQAFTHPTTWYFEIVYKKLGYEEIVKVLKDLNYGNCDAIGKDKFWMDSTLKISPKEQVEFLKKVFNFEYDFKKEHIGILKSLMFSEDFENGKIYGKTGTSDSGVSWWVGFYEESNSKIYFAVQIPNTDATQRKDVVKKFIKAEVWTTQMKQGN